MVLLQIDFMHLIGTCLKTFDPIYVSFEKSKDGKKEDVIQKINARVKNKHYMNNCPSGDPSKNTLRILFVAPESTTHNGKYVLPFRLIFYVLSLLFMF